MSQQPANKPRAVFVTHNQYQRDIVFLAFFPSVFIFLTFFGIVLLGNPSFSQALFHKSFVGSIDAVNKLSALIVILMCIIFILTLIGTYVMSHNMIGAYGRIIRELDEILEGKSVKKISYRPKDTLTKDLLKRVNVLIEFYVKHQK